MHSELRLYSVDKLLELAINTARQAGSAIMEYYKKSPASKYKQDGSPVTIADRVAHHIIVNQLASSNLIVISEEGKDTKMNPEQYWLVDPLDGTKDFLACNGEFTINIALINQNRPILGVIFAPSIGDLYWGAEGIGAFRIKEGHQKNLAHCGKPSYCRMAVSRFHDHPDVDIFAIENQIYHRIAIGSALKYGLLAASEVDVFPRLVGSFEWDTAAGQAVLESAGGQVLDWHTGKALAYGKLGRRNPRLLAIRSPYRLEEFKLKKYVDKLL